MFIHNQYSYFYDVYLGCSSKAEEGCYSPDAYTEWTHLSTRQVSFWFLGGEMCSHNGKYS